VALDTLESSVISRLAFQCRKVLDEIQPQAAQLNTLYNAVGGCHDTITQADLDSNPAYSGLTKQQLDDAAAVITNTMLTALNNGLTALSILAART